MATRMWKDTISDHLDLAYPRAQDARDLVVVRFQCRDGLGKDKENRLPHEIYSFLMGRGIGPQIALAEKHARGNPLPKKKRIPVQ